MLDPELAAAAGQGQQSVTAECRCTHKGGEVTAVDHHHDDAVEFVVGTIEQAREQDRLACALEPGRRQIDAQRGGIVVLVLKEKSGSRHGRRHACAPGG
ncbi:hypothetical protein [Massilia haematophila]|uniref:Uncharacterized protein n=1 Tax=Massilia haematophila TaxID=457923 RepID=A0ABV7PQE7_9BURK